MRFPVTGETGGSGRRAPGVLGWGFPFIGRYDRRGRLMRAPVIRLGSRPAAGVCIGKADARVGVGSLRADDMLDGVA